MREHYKEVWVDAVETKIREAKVDGERWRPPLNGYKKRIKVFYIKNIIAKLGEL